MAFNKALNQLESGLNSQLQKAGLDAQLQKQLKTILRQGKSAVIKEMKNAGVDPDANIVDTAEKQLNDNKGKIKKQTRRFGFNDFAPAFGGANLWIHMFDQVKKHG